MQFLDRLSWPTSISSITAKTMHDSSAFFYVRRTISSFHNIFPLMYMWSLYLELLQIGNSGFSLKYEWKGMEDACSYECDTFIQKRNTLSAFRLCFCSALFMSWVFNSLKKRAKRENYLVGFYKFDSALSQAFSQSLAVKLYRNQKPVKLKFFQWNKLIL